MGSPFIFCMMTALLFGLFSNGNPNPQSDAEVRPPHQRREAHYEATDDKPDAYYHKDKNIDNPYNTPDLRKEKRYHIELDTTLSWIDAHQFCKFHSMELASVLNAKEQAKLEKLLKQYERADAQNLWLSGMRIGEGTGAYYWVANGRKFIYRNWAANHPASNTCGNFCVMTNITVPSTWQAGDCLTKQAFICEHYEPVY